MMKKKFMYGVLLYIILLLPPTIGLLEKWMITHMLVQIPLLIIAGLLMGEYVKNRLPNLFKKWNENGIPGILLVYIVTIDCMIYRSMDEAILLYSVEIFKFISLPFLVGIVLYDSWPKLSSLAKGFIVFNYIPMFGMMAWLYIDSPIQVCNNYLESEQKDRKSTRLNSSHVAISYAVFCLKKKTTYTILYRQTCSKESMS